ncbi:hypothetical protein LBMAG48_02370 [Phycisphaerae bacterium]|nr:hypothetical protein LBMAG48_02370 [Phycisphaerae bacterium]
MFDAFTSLLHRNNWLRLLLGFAAVGYQQHTNNDERNTGDARRRDGVRRQADQTEAIDDQVSEYLARDDADDVVDAADLRNDEDGRAHVDRTEQATKP